MSAEVSIKKIYNTVTTDNGAWTDTAKYQILSSQSYGSKLEEMDIQVDRSVEVGSVFELQESSLDLSFAYDSSMWSFLADEAWLISNGEFAIDVTIDGSSVFWGVVEKDSLEYNQQKDTISFTGVGMYKFLHDKFQGYIIEAPSLSGDGVNYTDDDLDVFLFNYFGGNLVTSVNLEIGLQATNDLIGNDLYALHSQGMTLGQIIEEFQKQYGAYFFIDENKVLQVVNRGYLSGNYDSIDDNISEDDIIFSYIKPEYNSVVVHNEAGQDGFISDDYALFKYYTTYELEALSGDLDTIPPSYNYLDMRQKLSPTGTSGRFDYDTTWRLYKNGAKEFDLDTYEELFKNVIRLQEQLTCSVNETDIELYGSARYNSKTYIVVGVEVNYTQGYSHLVLKRIVE